MNPRPSYSPPGFPPPPGGLLESRIRPVDATELALGIGGFALAIILLRQVFKGP